jgi:hypothetical protein
MDIPPQLGTVLLKQIPFRSKVKPLREIMLSFLSHIESRASGWTKRFFVLSSRLGVSSHLAQPGFKTFSLILSVFPPFQVSRIDFCNFMKKSSLLVYRRLPLSVKGKIAHFALNGRKLRSGKSSAGSLASNLPGSFVRLGSGQGQPHFSLTRMLDLLTLHYRIDFPV